MEQITNFDMISPLIIKQLKPKILTNNFMTEKNYKDEISKSALYYHIWDGGLIFLRKREEFWKVNFYLSNIEKEIDFKIPKISVLEIVNKPNDSTFENTLKFWKANGFVEYTKRKRMQKIVNDFDNDNSSVRLAQIEDAQEIDSIMKECFDKYSGCLLDNQELEGEIKNNNIYCAISENKIVGILHKSNNKNISEIRHLAVKKEMRGKHYASELVKHYINDCKCNKNLVWVGSDNEIAQKFYKKNSYEFDGWISTVLILK
jgi:ribosomal protein S18 acetylase RimI-like enzyme